MALFSRPGANSAAAAGETLSGNVTLNDNDVFILRYNPNGSNWTIKDRASHRKHRGRILQNSGSSGNLMLTDKADNAIATVAPGESIMYGGTGLTIAYVPMNETTIPALNLGDSDPLNLGDGPDLVLQHNGTNSLVTNATGELQIDSAGALSLESSGGAINVGADAVAQAVNIATGGAARVITIGNPASASLNLDAGVGAFGAIAGTTMDLDATGALSLNSSGAAINVGNDNVAQALNLGTGGARTITLGSSSATSLTAAQSLTLSRGLNSAGRVTFWDDFFGAAGATIPIHWSKDVLNSATGDYGDGLEGRYTLAMTAADEAQAVQIVGPKINLDNGPILKCGFFSVDSTKFISVERFAIGLVDTHTNSEDSLDATTVNAWFRVEGAAPTALLWEVDDNVAGNDDDNATGITLVNGTQVEVEIDCTTLSAVLFKVAGVTVGTGDLSAVAADTVVRPIVVLQRDDNSGTESTPSIVIDYIEISASRG